MFTVKGQSDAIRGTGPCARTSVVGNQSCKSSPSLWHQACSAELTFRLCHPAALNYPPFKTEGGQCAKGLQHRLATGSGAQPSTDWSTVPVACATIRTLGLLPATAYPKESPEVKP